MMFIGVSFLLLCYVVGVMFQYPCLVNYCDHFLNYAVSVVVTSERYVTNNMQCKTYHKLVLKIMLSYFSCMSLYLRYFYV
ncbi:hypothetical protein AMTRI_Chr01g127250 [Amborella trichopoda]